MFFPLPSAFIASLVLDQSSCDKAPRRLPFISLFFSWPLTAFAELISTENMSFLFT